MDRPVTSIGYANSIRRFSKAGLLVFLILITNSAMAYRGLCQDPAFVIVSGVYSNELFEWCKVEAPLNVGVQDPGNVLIWAYGIGGYVSMGEGFSVGENATFSVRMLDDNNLFPCGAVCH